MENDPVQTRLFNPTTAHKPPAPSSRKPRRARDKTPKAPVPIHERGYEHQALYYHDIHGWFLSRRRIHESGQNTIDALWGATPNGQELLVSCDELKLVCGKAANGSSPEGITPQLRALCLALDDCGFKGRDRVAVRRLLAQTRREHPLAFRGTERLGDWVATATPDAKGERYEVHVTHVPSAKSTHFNLKCRRQPALGPSLDLLAYTVRNGDVLPEFVDGPESKALRREHKKLVKDAEALVENGKIGATEGQRLNPGFLDFHEYDHPMGYTRGPERNYDSVSFHLGYPDGLDAQVEELAQRWHDLVLRRDVAAAHAYAKAVHPILNWAGKPTPDAYWSHGTICLVQERLIESKHWLIQAAAANPARTDLPAALLETQALLAVTVASPAALEACGWERLFQIFDGGELQAPRKKGYLGNHQWNEPGYLPRLAHRTVQSDY